ncbi:MAG: hypothetical protein V4749_05765 [Pseudomonadota bacterium]
MSTSLAPSAHKTDSWMSDNKEALGRLKLHELTLPSAHNAGVDKKGVGGVTEGWVACQEDSFLYQLRGGMRVLDLRIEKVNSFNYRFFHGPVYSSRSVEDLIENCLAFYSEGRGTRDNEIIILDINKVSSRAGGFDYAYVAGLILEGLAGKLVPSSASGLTLKQIREQHPGKTIIVCWSMNAGDLIWPGIYSDWVADDLPSLNQLKEYISTTINETYPPGGLRSLQVVKYSKLYGPEKIYAAINEWFPASSPWLRKTNIINVDFFETTHIVQNCITANLYKAAVMPPTAPGVRVHYQPDDRLLVVSLTKSTDNLRVSHYVVTVNNVPKEVPHREKFVVHSASFKMEFNTPYTGTAYAVDNTGLKSASVAFSGNTGADPVPGTPDIIGAERTRIGNADIITVGWIKTLPHGTNIETSIYKAEDFPLNTPVAPPVETKLLPITAAAYTFTKLTPSQRYVITVGQVNGLGKKGETDITSVAPKTV